MTLSLPTQPPHAPLKHSPKITPPKKDLWEDTPLRYLGYTDEVAECWDDVVRHKVGAVKGKLIYDWAYRITAIYAGIDAIDKGWKAYQNSAGQGSKQQLGQTAIAAAQTGVFQLLASYVIPPLLIKHARKALVQELKRIPANNFLLPKGGTLRTYLPGIACMALMPIIAPPIDKAVHHATKLVFKTLSKLTGVTYPEVHPH